MAKLRVIDKRPKGELHLTKTAEDHGGGLLETLGFDIDAVIPEKATTAEVIEYNIILVRGALNSDEVLADKDIKAKAKKLNEMFDPADDFFKLKKNGNDIVLQITEVEADFVQYIKEEFSYREKKALDELAELIKRSVNLDEQITKHDGHGHKPKGPHLSAFHDMSKPPKKKKPESKDKGLPEFKENPEETIKKIIDAKGSDGASHELSDSARKSLADFMERERIRQKKGKDRGDKDQNWFGKN